MFKISVAIQSPDYRCTKLRLQAMGIQTIFEKGHMKADWCGHRAKISCKKDGMQFIADLGLSTLNCVYVCDFFVIVCRRTMQNGGLETEKFFVKTLSKQISCKWKFPNLSFKMCNPSITYSYCAHCIGIIYCT